MSAEPAVPRKKFSVANELKGFQDEIKIIFFLKDSNDKSNV